jgi:hypothetical protein
MANRSILQLIQGNDNFISYRWGMKSKAYGMSLAAALEKRGLELFR